MKCAEEFETLLHFFGALLRDMDTPTLELFRAHCMRMHRGTQEHQTVVEVMRNRVQVTTDGMNDYVVVVGSVS